MYANSRNYKTSKGSDLCRENRNLHKWGPLLTTFKCQTPVSGRPSTELLSRLDNNDMEDACLGLVSLSFPESQRKIWWVFKCRYFCVHPWEMKRRGSAVLNLASEKGGWKIFWHTDYVNYCNGEFMLNTSDIRARFPFLKILFIIWNKEKRNASFLLIKILKKKRTSVFIIKWNYFAIHCRKGQKGSFPHLNNIKFGL